MPYTHLTPNFACIAMRIGHKSRSITGLILLDSMLMIAFLSDLVIFMSDATNQMGLYWEKQEFDVNAKKQ